MSHGRRLLALLALELLGACAAAPMDDDRVSAGSTASARPSGAGRVGHDLSASDDSTVTLAFAGDVHFQLHLAALLQHPRGALGPITEVLRRADLTMLNLESAITTRGTLEAKELEVAGQRFYFRTSAGALDVLAEAGVDVVTVANNHGADYGPVGLADTLRATHHAPVAVVGIGENRREAFTPHLVAVQGTRIAFLAGDASMREGSSNVWAAGPHTPGIAAAHADRPRVLIAAVRAASRHADVVVVYMHWGEELWTCPSRRQRAIARALAAAGADVVVGSHAHLLQGAGWLGDTYVDYGLGNFVWYHNEEPVTGVLELRIRDGHVVRDGLVPARIGFWGRPRLLHGAARTAALADWRGLRACTDLDGRPPV